MPHTEGLGHYFILKTGLSSSLIRVRPNFSTAFKFFRLICLYTVIAGIPIFSAYSATVNSFCAMAQIYTLLYRTSKSE